MIERVMKYVPKSLYAQNLSAALIYLLLAIILVSFRCAKGKHPTLSAGKGVKASFAPSSILFYYSGEIKYDNQVGVLCPT